MAGERKMTQDHDTIRRWVEARGGSPATVESTQSADDPGIIRIDFPGYSGGGSLTRISWEEWFQKFDESGLVFLYQETLADGGQSNFNKLISRETADQNDSGEWVGGERSGRSSARGGESEAKRSRGGGRGDTIDLNKASAEELDGVFGIGPATAQKIIDYRDRDLGGRFHSVHDLTHIPGIGESTAELIASKAKID